MRISMEFTQSACTLAVGLSYQPVEGYYHRVKQICYKHDASHQELTC